MQQILPHSPNGQDKHRLSTYNEQESVGIAASCLEQVLFQIDPKIVSLRSSRIGIGELGKMTDGFFKGGEPCCGPS